MTKWPDLKELANRALQPGMPSRTKTRVWSRLELALGEASANQVKEIRELQEALDLRKHSQNTAGLLEALWVAFKLLVCLITVLVLAPIEIIVSPIAYFNPLWKKLGLKNNTLPTEMLQLLTFRWACCCLGLQICTEGEEQLPDTPMIFMYSHASNLDPIAIGAVTPFPLKFIAKRIIFYFPVLGWLFKAYGHIPIDRANRESAIESLKFAARNVCRSNVSIAISPEGTRSVSGHLQSFKKGPFYLSSRSRLPIAPVVILNGYDRMPPVGYQVPRPGRITIRYMKPITAHLDDPNLEVDELSRIVRETMLRGLAQDDDESLPRKVYNFYEPLFTILPAALIVIYLFIHLYLNRYF